jgi:hypothetical protein
MYYIEFSTSIGRQEIDGAPPQDGDASSFASSSSSLAIAQISLINHHCPLLRNYFFANFYQQHGIISCYKNLQPSLSLPAFRAIDSLPSL